MEQVAANIAAIRGRMKKAGDDGRVNLIAVSKMQSEERVRAALGAGHRLFGENKVQEARTRWPALKREFPDVRLHFIGHLQTNKVKDAVALFDVIETVDSAKLAAALDDEMEKQGRRLPCFIQVNTGEEPQKGGVIPSRLPALLDECKKLHLEISGLMCIPPENEPPALHFALLKKLAARHGLKDLSMGMSADFEKAIPLGATYIRVGTALFGERQ